MHATEAKKAAIASLDLSIETSNVVPHFLRRTVRVGRASLPMAPVVGVPFGSVFEASPDGRRLQRVTESVPQLSISMNFAISYGRAGDRL